MNDENGKHIMSEADLNHINKYPEMYFVEACFKSGNQNLIISMNGRGWKCRSGLHWSSNEYDVLYCKLCEHNIKQV